MITFYYDSEIMHEMHALIKQEQGIFKLILIDAYVSHHRL